MTARSLSLSDDIVPLFFFLSVPWKPIKNPRDILKTPSSLKKTHITEAKHRELHNSLQVDFTPATIKQIIKDR